MGQRRINDNTQFTPSYPKGQTLQAAELLRLPVLIFPQRKTQDRLSAILRFYYLNTILKNSDQLLFTFSSTSSSFRVCSRRGNAPPVRIQSKETASVRSTSTC